MYCVISTLPYDSPLLRQEHGKDYHWYGPITDILAGAYDTLGVIAATQQQRRKWKRSDLPKPLTRPWDKKKFVEKLGGKPIPITDLAKRLGWIKEK